MKYVGIHTQIRRNNMRSALLLLAFPCIILGMVWLFLFLITYFGGGYTDAYGNVHTDLVFSDVLAEFLQTVPWVIIGVGIWFLIAYFANAAMVQSAVNAHSLSRKDNPRVYNIVENLCMTCGMDMPKINVVNDPQLNAFASGINKSSYTVTVTTGLLSLLNDEELAGVIGHELTHIRNRDTRLLITSIVFVGIISTIMSLTVRMLYYNFLFSGGRRSNKERDNGLSAVVVLAIAAVCCLIAYIFTLLTRFAISRKREFMADAGGAELCGNPRALASALRKISGDPGLNNVQREDVAQLFIIRPSQFTQGVMSFMNNLFSTHPDTAQRIAILEQF